MKTVSISLALLVLFYAAYSLNYEKKVEIPVLPATWWGPGREGNPQTSVRPFNISFSDEVTRSSNFYFIFGKNFWMELWKKIVSEGQKILHEIYFRK